MKYYKDSNNKVYAYESDGSQDAFIKPDLTPISEAEAMELANPPPTKEELYQSNLDSQLSAYKTESDPLKLEAEYDALINNTEPDYSVWIAKVQEIKARYPLSEGE